MIFYVEYEYYIYEGLEGKCIRQINCMLVLFCGPHQLIEYSKTSNSKITDLGSA